jgi:hypothetical protein
MSIELMPPAELKAAVCSWKSDAVARRVTGSTVSAIEAMRPEMKSA